MLHDGIYSALQLFIPRPMSLISSSNCRAVEACRLVEWLKDGITRTTAYGAVLGRLFDSAPRARPWCLNYIVNLISGIEGLKQFTGRTG